MQKLGLLYSINKQQQMKKLAEETWALDKKDHASIHDPSQLEKQINRLLDIYNDYHLLFKWFGDEEYLQVMKAAIRELKRLTKN